jgi:mannose-6-phosphate isomerase-like protein (cupin superfamily)
MRVNQFTVISGIVQIQEWYQSGEFHVKTLLPGDTHCVGVGVLHRFRVLESGTMVEVYWPVDVDDAVVRQDDIVRFDEGGPDA